VGVAKSAGTCSGDLVDRPIKTNPDDDGIINGNFVLQVFWPEPYVRMDGAWHSVF
jgi:hypothetical protein